MSSIVFGKSDSYLNIGTDVEWRRVLRHHTTSLWVKTSCQSRCCLVSLQNEGFEVFGIDINLSSNPIAAASTVLQRDQQRAVAATRRGAATDAKDGALSASVKGLGSVVDSEEEEDDNDDAGDSDEEGFDDAIFDAFAPASVYFPSRGKVAVAAGDDAPDDDGDGDDDSGNVSEDDDCNVSPLKRNDRLTSMSVRSNSISASKLAGKNSHAAGSDAGELVNIRNDRLARTMLAKARVRSQKAQHSQRQPLTHLGSLTGGFDVPDTVTISPSSVGESHYFGNDDDSARKKDSGTLPCHVDTERRNPAGGFRVRLQDCAGNVLVAVSEIPVIADDKWHKVEVTIVPKGLQVPELLEGGGGGVLGGLPGADGDVDPLSSLMAMVDPSQDPLVVLDAKERKMPAEYVAKSESIRYSNAMVRLVVDGQEVNMRHYTRRHDAKVAAERRRECKRRWKSEMLALEADIARVEQQIQNDRSNKLGISFDEVGSVEPHGSIHNSFEGLGARGDSHRLASLRSSFTTSANNHNNKRASIVDNTGLVTGIENRRRSEALSTQHFRDREEAIDKLYKQYELQKHLSKVFLLSNDYTSVGIVQRNLYPAPDLIGARNRQAIVSSDKPSRPKDGEQTDNNASALNRLTHYFCGRIADIRVVDNSIGADLEQLCRRGLFGQAESRSASIDFSVSSNRSNRLSLFALPVTATAARTSITANMGKMMPSSFVGGLLKRNALTGTDRAATPHPTGIAEQLRWWATDCAEGLTVWDRGVSSTEFDGEVFVRLSGGKPEAVRASFTAAGTTAEGGPSTAVSNVGGLHNGARIQPLHLHMCNCAWDKLDCPQSAMFLDSSLGYTARIPALSRRVLSMLVGNPLRLEGRLRLAVTGRDDGVAGSSVLQQASLAPLSSRELAIAESTEPEVKNFCSVSEEFSQSSDATVISAMTVLGANPLRFDPFQTFEASQLPLRRKSTNAPGDMRRPTSGEGGAHTNADGAHLADGGEGGASHKSLANILVEKGFGFSIWLRTESTEPSLVVSFPFGRDVQKQPTVTNDSNLATARLLALTELQDVHLFLNCERHPSITLILGHWAYISYTNVCNGAWNQVSWSLDQTHSLSLRINNDPSTYEAVDLTASCLSVRRHLRLVEKRRADLNGEVRFGSGSDDLGGDDGHVTLGRNKSILVAGKSNGARSRSSPAQGNAITWAGKETVLNLPEPEDDEDKSNAEDDTEEIFADLKSPSLAPRSPFVIQPNVQIEAKRKGTICDSDTIEILRKAVGSNIHNDDDVEILQNIDAESVSSTDLDEGEDVASLPEEEGGGDDAAADQSSALGSGSFSPISPTEASPASGAGNKKHRRAHEESVGDKKGSHLNISLQPANHLPNLVKTQKRSKYELAEKDRKYEKNLKKRYGITAMDRHRDTRTALLTSSDTAPTGGKRSLSANRAAGSVSSLLYSDPNDPAALGYLSALPVPRTRGDRVLRIIVGVLGEVRDANFARAMVGATDTPSDGRALAEMRRQQAELLSGQAGGGPLAAMQQTNVLAKQEEAKVFSAVAVTMQRHCQPLVSSATDTLAACQPLSPAALFATSTRGGGLGDTSVANLSFQSAPTMWRSAAPHSSSFSHDVHSQAPSMSEASVHRGGGGGGALGTIPAARGALMDGVHLMNDPSTAATHRLNEDVPKAKTFAVEKWKPSAGLIEMDDSDGEEENADTIGACAGNVQSPQHNNGGGDLPQIPLGSSGCGSAASSTAGSSLGIRKKRHVSASEACLSPTMNAVLPMALSSTAGRQLLTNAAPEISFPTMHTSSDEGASNKMAALFVDSRNYFNTNNNTSSSPANQLISVARRAQMLHASHALQVCAEVLSSVSSFALTSHTQAPKTEDVASYVASQSDVVTIGSRYCGGVRDLVITFGEVVEFYFPLSEGRGRDVMSRPPANLKPRQNHVDTLMGSRSVANKETLFSDGKPDLLVGFAEPPALLSTAPAVISEWSGAVAYNPSHAAEVINGSALVDALQAPLPHGCVSGTKTRLLPPSSARNVASPPSSGEDALTLKDTMKSVFSNGPGMVEETHRSIIQINVTEDPFLATLLLLTRLKVETTGRVCLWEKAQLPSSYCVVTPAVALRLGPVILPASDVQLEVVGYTMDPDEDDEEDEEDDALGEKAPPPPVPVESEDDEANSDDAMSQSQSMGSSNTIGSPLPAAVVMLSEEDSLAQSTATTGTERGDASPAEEGSPSAMTAFMRKKKEKAEREKRRLERKAQRSRDDAKQAAASAAKDCALGAVRSHIRNDLAPKGLRRAAKLASFDGSIVFRGFFRLTADGDQNYYGHAATLNGLFILDIDREAVRVVVRESLSNVVRNANSSTSGSQSPSYHAISRSIGGDSDSATPSAASRSFSGKMQRRQSANSDAHSVAPSLKSAVTSTGGLVPNPLPLENQPQIPGLNSAPYSLIPREQVLIIYSCATLVFEDHKWHYIELTLKPQIGAGLTAPSSVPPALQCRAMSVSLVVDHVNMPLSPIAIDYRGYRALVRRQQQAAVKTTTANAMTEVEMGRRGRRGPTRVGFSGPQAAAAVTSGEDTEGGMTKRSSLGQSTSQHIGGSLSPSHTLSRQNSASVLETSTVQGTGGQGASESSRGSSMCLPMLMYAGPSSSLSTVRSGHVRCKNLEIKWRELVEYVPTVVGETVLFSGMFGHDLYLGGCGWHGGVRDVELLVNGSKRVWPLDDGTGGRLTQFPLASDPTLTSHVKALPKPFRKLEEPSRLVAVANPILPSAPSAGSAVLSAASPLSQSMSIQNSRSTRATSPARPNPPASLMLTSTPVNTDSVTAGYTAAAAQWKPSQLPMQALTFDGRYSVASAVNFGHVFKPPDFKRFTVSFWVKQGVAGQRAMALGRSNKGASKPGHGGGAPRILSSADPSNTKRGCLLSVHDIVFPSLEASLGVYAHTTLDMFSSPKKRESSPYTTLFVLLDSSERGLVLETTVDIYDGSWHKIEWRVNNAELNDTVILINDRPAAVTVVAAEGPRDFQGQMPCLTVGARNDGDGGIREHFKGEIKNLAISVGSEKRRRNASITDGARRRSTVRRGSVAFSDAFHDEMTPVLEWPMSEGRGGLLYDTLKNVVGVVLRPVWGVTSFPPQVPRLRSDSTLRFASISDLSRAYFKRGVRIDITIKTGHTGIGSVFALQSPSRRIVGGLVLNTNGGTSGTLLTPPEEMLNFKLARDGSYASLTSFRSVTSSEGGLKSPRHRDLDESLDHAKLHEMLGLDDDVQGGVGMLDPEMIEAARSSRIASDRVDLHEPGTHTFIIQHVTQRLIYRPQEHYFAPQSKRNLQSATPIVVRSNDVSFTGSNVTGHSTPREGSVSLTSPVVPVSIGAARADNKSRSRNASDDGGRKKLVLATGKERLTSFIGPQLVAVSEGSEDESDDFPLYDSSPASEGTLSEAAARPASFSANQRGASTRRKDADASTAAAMALHLKAATLSKGLPPQRLVVDHPELIKQVMGDAPFATPDDDDDEQYGGQMYRSRRNLKLNARKDMLGQMETVVEELQFQFHCDELSDENWHQIQIVLPSNPYDAEVRIDEIRMPLMIVTAKIVAIVPDGFERLLKETRKAVPTPAEVQFGWESLVIGRTARVKAFVGDIKNISLSSFDDSSFLYVPLANHTGFSSTMKREVATSNIDWELTVSPPSCLSFSDQEHVVLPALASFRYDCFQIEALLATVHVDAHSCFLEYGAEGSGLVTIHLNEDVTGEHRPYFVHILVIDQAGRELRADFYSPPLVNSSQASLQGIAESSAPCLFDSHWHRLKIVVQSSRENDIFVYIDEIPIDVRYGNCGSPCEFAYADEGGTIGAQVVDLKPQLPFCGKLQQFILSDPRTDEIHATYTMDAGYGSILQDGSGKRNHAVIHNVQWKSKMVAEKSTLLAASGHTEALADGEVTILTTPQLHERRKTNKRAITSPALPIFEGQKTPASSNQKRVESASAVRQSVAGRLPLKIPHEATDLMANAHRGRCGDRTSSITRLKGAAQSIPNARQGVVLTTSRWSNSTMSTHHRSIVTGETIMPYWPGEEGGWESGAPGPQWITIDLGEPCTIFSVSFELPRSFSTTYQLFFSRINLNESYSANRPAMEEGKAVPIMSLAEQFNFTASTARVASSHFPLPYFNVRWIRLRCSEPLAVQQTVGTSATAAARQLRERQAKQLYVTLRSLKVIGMSNAFIAPKRETVVTVLQRKSLQAQSTGALLTKSQSSMIQSVGSAANMNGLRSMSSRTGSIPFFTPAEDDTLTSALAELHQAELEQAYAEEEAEIYAVLNPPPFALGTIEGGTLDIPSDDGRSSTMPFNIAPLRLGTLRSSLPTSEETLSPAGRVLTSQRNFSLQDSSSVARSGQQCTPLTTGRMSRTSLVPAAAQANEGGDGYAPVLLRLRQPYLAWRRSDEKDALPAVGTNKNTNSSSRKPSYAATPSPAHQRRSINLPPLPSTPPTRLFGLRQAETLPPVSLAPGELPSHRLSKPPQPIPELVPRPSQILHPRSMLGAVPQPLPPINTEDEGKITTDGALISKPAFERYVQVTNGADRRNDPSSVRGSLLRVAGATDDDSKDKSSLDPVAKERARKERELQLLFYRFDVRRAGAVNLNTFWHLYEAVGGELNLTVDGEDEALMEDLDEEQENENETPPSPFPPVSFGAAYRYAYFGDSPIGGPLNTTSQAPPPSVPSSPIARMMAREKQRRAGATREKMSTGQPLSARLGGVTSPSRRSPRKVARRSGETRARERVLRTLSEVGVPIPYKMFHSNLDEEEEKKRKQYLQEVRQGQLGVSNPAVLLAEKEDLPPHRIMITFDQFNRAVSRLQRF